MPANPEWTWLCDERKAIAAITPDRSQPTAYSGLALSGGGIRSAAVCLGVLQALHAAGSLGRFHYLSTVSGGGYTGLGWLARAAGSKRGFPFDPSGPEREAEGDPAPQRRRPPPRSALDHLRDYASYLLAPGAASLVDGLGMLARKFLANLVSILPVVLLIAVWTALLSDASRRAALLWQHPTSIWVALAGGLLLLILVGSLSESLTSQRDPRDAPKLRHLLDRGGALGLVGLAFLAILPNLHALLEGAHRLFAKQLGLDIPSTLAMVATSLPVGTLASRLRGRGSVPVLALLGLIFLIGILLLVAELARALAAPAEDGGSKLAALLPAAWAPYLMPGPAQPEAAKLLGWVGLAACAFGAIAAVFRPAGRWRAARRRWAFRGILFGVPLLLCGWLFAQEEVGSRIDWAALAAASVLSLAVLGLAWLCIDPNATSLHGFYRDRLADAFLGDARGINAPGATPTETPRLLGMSGLLPERTRGPFPILNATVNGAPSKDMARRGRRGAPFTITPLQAGNVTLDYCRTAELEKAAPDFDIAAAIALSGAALSPNAGSTSGSWFSVFLKGLLNVRTGRWLPAPEVAKNGTRPGSPSPEQFFLEVTGIRRTTEHDRWVFVSDGGHFENLGLLSLLHRRCDLILVVDSEADPQMRCNGLAVVTRLARLDLGAEIEIDVSPLRLDAQGYTRAHIVEGCVRYAATDPIRPSGVARLIYVKSSVNGDEAVDIAEYRSRHPAFPQETTADQFFSEEQFEAYRALGVHMGQAALPKLSGASKDVAADAAARQWPDPCRAA